jgi:hypothetical protein
MNFKILLFKKIYLWVLLLTILLSIIVTILFGSAVTRSKTALKIAKSPETIKLFLKGHYDGSLKVDRFNKRKGLHVHIKSKSDEYLLLSRFDGNLKSSVVDLYNIKENKLIHSWRPNLKKISFNTKNKKIIDLKKDHNLTRYVISHPLFLSNGDLVIHGQWTPLTKIDMCSNIIWSLDYAFHHSTEKDYENNYWIPFTYMPNKVSAGMDERIGPFQKYFLDDGIMKVSKDGEVLFKKSVMQILIDNNLENLIFPGEPSFDPIHLNDIQPVSFDGKNFKRGDIFLSFRSISVVALYRPSTNKILWYKKNPWVNQHDVDILNSTQISIFNNKSKILFSGGQNIYDASVKKNNNILIYDFEKDKISNNYEQLFVKNDIRTPTQGLSEIMKDGSVYIEESDFGRLLKFNKEGKLILEYINRADNGHLYPLKWFRIVNKIDKSFFNKLKTKGCDEN